MTVLGHPVDWEITPEQLEPVETDLHIDARELTVLAEELELHVGDYTADDELVLQDDDLIAWKQLDDACRVIADARDALAKRLAEAMPEKRQTVMGTGTFEKHFRTDRKQWDTDALKSAVLDSRLADTETGEFLDETPIEKITAVWNLGAPRVTVLRERGIDPDQFCTTEKRGLTLQVIA